MKKSKLLLPATAIAALGAVTPMVAMTGCSKSQAKSNFVTDSWVTLIANCKTACDFYNAYIKKDDETKMTDEEAAVTAIRTAIVESACLLDQSYKDYRFERTIPVETAIGQVELAIRLIDVGKDKAADESTTKTTFTFEFVDTIGTGVFDSNRKGWIYDTDQSSVIRTFLQNIFTLMIPAEVKNAIVPVTKSTNLSTTDNVDAWTDNTETAFIIGKREFGISDEAVGYYNPGEYTYAFYSKVKAVDGNALNNPIFEKNLYDIEGTRVCYWTRTPRKVSASANNYVWDAENSKIVGVNRARAYGIAPIFNI